MTTFSRRDFLHFATAAGLAAALPIPAFARRVRGANDRIRIGVIGTGGIGHVHIQGLLQRAQADNVELTRVCDVYRRRLNSALKLIGGQPAQATLDYREVIDAKDVDAVVIATPDHWHTKMAIEAMEAGKDVYCEKPLSLTIQQAIECRDAVKRTGRVLQVGPQGTSDPQWRAARDAIGKGRIGKVVWSQSSYCRNSRGGQFNWRIDPDASPTQDKNSDGYVWWDQWLGHEHGLAENIPWNPDHFFRFRKYFAYNGGVATDLMYHKLAPLLIAISGENGEYPTRVTAAGGRYIEKDERDIPDSMFLMIDYPSEHTIVLASVMTNDVGVDDLIRGQFGTMSFRNSAMTIREQAAWHPEFRTANADLVKTGTTTNDKGQTVPDPAPGRAEALVPAPAGGSRDHMGNFLDSVRGTAKPNCNIELGCSTMVAIKMGVEAYRRNKVMKWDAARQQAVEA